MARSWCGDVQTRTARWSLNGVIPRAASGRHRHFAQRIPARNSMKLPAPPLRNAIPRARTGIAGLDEMTNGGLPAGRTTLLVGGPGSGKTILALQFLVH